MEQNHNKVVGARLREVYRRHNWTQERLAEEIGYSDPNMVSMIVCGRRALTQEKALKIVELFPEVRLDWLLGRSDYESEAEEKLYEAASEVVSRERFNEAIQTFLHGTQYSFATPADFQQMNMEIVPPRYAFSHEDQLIILGTHEIDTFFGLIQNQITSQIEFMIRQQGAKKEDAKIAKMINRVDKQKKTASGADTPEADQGQKESNPLPSQDNTDGR